MEKQYSVKFFTSFIESLQNICQEHLTFDQVVEVSGYVSVEIDNSRKERYVLSEFLQACGNILSESYCTKVYKNLPSNVRERNKSGSATTDEDKENHDRTGSTSSGVTFVSLFDNSQNHKRKNSNQIPESSFSTKEPEQKKAKHTARKSMASSSNKLPKSSCSIEIESRSSSFLASSAKWMSTSSEKNAPRTETLQDFVSSVVDSLGSPKPDSSNSDEDIVPQVHFATHPVLSSKLSQDSSSLTRPSTNPSSSSKLPISLPSLFSFKSKQPKSSKKSSFFKASISQSKPSHARSLSNEARSSCSKSEDLIPADMNVSSLRHLVSKSYEDSPTLEQRPVGGAEDILPGQAYIELVEDGQGEDGREEGEDGGAIISLDELPGEAEPPDPPTQTNKQSPGAEVPCTVSSSSLMLDAGSVSTPTSMDDSHSCQLAISEDEADEPGNLDSPIIIELDSDEDEDCDGESEPYAIKELRTLDTFKDYVKFAVKRFQAFTKEKGISEPIFRIPTTKLDPLLAEFYVTVRNKRGEDFGISTLKSIPSYLELYLRENGYPVSITRDTEFSNCRSMLQTKIRQIQEVQQVLMRRDIDRMFRADQISDSTAQTLTNAMWLMNTLLFKVRREEHSLLKWGDITLQLDKYQRQYLELHRPDQASPCHKVYPNNANPDRCFVKMYRLFERRRPANSLSPIAPFYLAVDEQNDLFKNEKMESKDINAILRNMLIKSGIQADKQIVDHDIL